MMKHDGSAIFGFFDNSTNDDVSERCRLSEPKKKRGGGTQESTTLSILAAMSHNIPYYGTVYKRVEYYWLKIDSADESGSSDLHSVKINPGAILQTINLQFEHVGDCRKLRLLDCFLSIKS
jgi:hypothetical protein